MVWCGQKHQKKVTTCTMSCKISAEVYKWTIKAAQVRRPNSDMNNKTFQHHHESFWWSLWGHWTSRWIFALIFPSQMFFGDPHWKAPDQRQIGTPVCDNRYVWSVQRRDPKVCQPAGYPNIRWSQRVGEPGNSSSQWDQTLLCFPPPSSAVIHRSIFLDSFWLSCIYWQVDNRAVWPRYELRSNYKKLNYTPQNMLTNLFTFRFWICPICTQPAQQN